MKNQLRDFVFTLCTVITGCGVTSPPRQTWVDSTASIPTAFGENTREVMCMRELLVPFENTPKSFALHRFEDHTGKSLTTGEIPQSLRVAAQSALIHLGNAVRSINLDPSVTESVAQRGYSGFQVPDYVIQGAITGFDSDVHGTQTRRSFDGLGGGGNGELDLRFTRASAWSFSNLTISMTAETRRGVSIPRGTATMQANLERSQADGEAAFGVGPVGGGSASRVRFIEGGHAAAHHMLQLATIKLVGETFSVPYWTCSSELITFAPPRTSVRLLTGFDAIRAAKLYCGVECGERRPPDFE